jgi:hypothetical protein
MRKHKEIELRLEFIENALVRITTALKNLNEHMLSIQIFLVSKTLEEFKTRKEKLGADTNCSIAQMMEDLIKKF